jgi:arginyl-tRNA synthetase
MIFNPEESIDFHGFTGPFIQYTHARIRSILRKNEINENISLTETNLLSIEKELLLHIEQYKNIIIQSANDLDPSALSIYLFQLAQIFNSFYAGHSISNAETEIIKQLRLKISLMTSNVINSGMAMLGIRVPEKM